MESRKEGGIEGRRGKGERGRKEKGKKAERKTEEKEQTGEGVQERVDQKRPREGTAK